VSGKRREIVLLVLLFIGAAQSARAETANQAVREANRLYQQGQYEGAIDKYDQALTKSPEAVEPMFNKADSYFRLDDLQQAIDLFRAVAAESRDMQLVEKAKYNLGNCFFRQGTKLADSDLKKAMENMQTAISYWRQVLDINPDNENAAKNIEVARLTIKDIIDQLNKQMQQQQQQAQQQKQLQQDLKQILDEQKALGDKTQQTKQQADSNDISQQQASDNYKDIAKEQSELRDRTEKAMEQLQQQLDPNTAQPQMQQASEQLGVAVDKQKDAGKKLEKSDAAGGKRSQDEAAENIENALKALSEQQQSQQDVNQQQQQQQGSEQPEQQQAGQPQEPNEAQQQQQVTASDATAEEILDKEQRQREKRQLLQSPGFQKVDKDW